MHACIHLYVQICALDDGEQVTLDWAVSNRVDAECGLESSMSKTPILIINPGACGHTKTLMGEWTRRAHDRGIYA